MIMQSKGSRRVGDRRGNRRLSIAGVLCCCALGMNCAQAQLASNVNSGVTYATIGAALTAASDGQTIELHTGVYNENVSIAKHRLTLRAADGHHPIIAPPSGKGVFVTSSKTNVCVQGLAIAGGTTMSHGIHVDSNCFNARILDNTVTTANAMNANHVFGIVMGAGAKTGDANATCLVVGNVVTNIGNQAAGFAAIAMEIGWDASRCTIQSNRLERLTCNHTSICGLRIYGSYNMIADNAILDYSGNGNNSYPAPAVLFSDGANNNRLERNVVGSSSTATAGFLLQNCRNNILNANTVRSSPVLGLRFMVSTATSVWTNNVFANNRFLRGGGNNSATQLVELPSNYTGTGAGANRYLNNLVVARTGGFTHEASDPNSRLAGSSYDGNTFLRCAGSTHGIYKIQTPPAVLRNNAMAAAQPGGATEWRGTFQSGTVNVSDGFSGTHAATDCPSGWWAREPVSANTATTWVTNSLNVNALGSLSRVLVCTTNDATASDPDGFVMVDLHANRFAAVGLPGPNHQALNRTVRTATSMFDGSYLARIEWACDLDDHVSGPGTMLYVCNYDSYPDQTWQPAVARNLVNAGFPVNDIRYVGAAKDMVLGHYGYDPFSRVLWANVNYQGDFTVVLAPPSGTVITIR